MHEARVLQLYPEPCGERSLAGLYLDHELHALGTAERPMVYGNFVSSLDGRIALTDAQGHSATPQSLTTGTDWQLFQELHAQADCIITHGAYLRALSTGRLGNILQVGLRPEARHLRAWRLDRGFAAQPDIVVASGSLAFDLPESVHAHGQRVIIATGSAGDGNGIERWRKRGVEVLISGDGTGVRGGTLIRALGDRGYRSIYLLAGPRILETMLRDTVLCRLYLTVSHRLVGGERFHTMLVGAVLGEEGRLALRSLHYRPASVSEDGQFFACFDTPRLSEHAPAA